MKNTMFMSPALGRQPVKGCLLCTIIQVPQPTLAQDLNTQWAMRVMIDR